MLYVQVPPSRSFTQTKSGCALDSANAKTCALDSTIVHAYPTLDIIACVNLKLWTHPRSKADMVAESGNTEERNGACRVVTTAAEKL